LDTYPLLQFTSYRKVISDPQPTKAYQWLGENWLNSSLAAE